MLVRGVCFSLVQIGEHMNKLHELIGEKYPNIPWIKAIGLRNLIVHVYHRVKAEIIYETVTKDLDPLKQSLLEIKGVIDN